MATSAAAPPPAANAPTNAEICGFFFAPALAESAPAGPSASPAAADGLQAAPGRVSAPLEPSKPPLEPSKPPKLEPSKPRRKPQTSAGGRANRHRCRLCGNAYTQNASTGYTNLMTHLRIKHADWPALFRARRLPDGSSTSVDPASMDALPDELPLPAPVRMAVGRKRGPVYEHYAEPADEQDADGAKGRRMRCVHCGARVPMLSARLKLHLASGCDAAPDAVKTDYALQLAAAEPRTSKRQKRAAEAEASGDDETAGTSATPRPEMPAQDLNAAMSATPVKTPTPSVAGTPTRSPKARAAVPSTFEDKLTAALVSARAPWALLDNAHFRDALALLARGKPPADFPLTAARASTVVVGRMADEYNAMTASSLSNTKFVTLVVDRRPVKSKQWGPKAERFSIVASDESRRSFLLTSRVGSAEKNIAAKVVCELEEIARTHAFPKSVNLSVCADATNGSFAELRKLLNDLKNLPAAVMEEDVASNANRFTLIGSCMAQQSALLLRDIIRNTDASDIISDVVAIARALPSLSDLPASSSDWASTALVVYQISRAEANVRAEFANTVNAETIANNVLYTILASRIASKDFWTSLSSVDALVAPMNACSTLSEMPMTTSGQFLSLWLWAFAMTMESPLLKSKEKFAERFFNRIETYVEDHCIASMMLDPRVRGAGLSNSGLRRARGVVVRVALSLLPDLDETGFVRSYNDFMKKQGDFGDDGLWNPANTSDPMQFWSDFEDDALHAQLAHVALAVCAFVPNSRSFQSFWSLNEEEDCIAGASDMLAKIRYSLDDGSTAREQHVRALASKVGGLMDSHTPAVAPTDANEQKACLMVAFEADVPSLEDVLDAMHDHMTQDFESAHKVDAPPRMDASWLDLSGCRSVWI